MAQDVIGERLRIGVNPRDASLPIVDVAERTAVESASKGEKYFEVYTANALGGAYVVLKARGTAAAPGNVLQDDSLGAFYAKGYSNGFQNTASMEILVDAAVVAGQRPASRVEIKTNENNAAPRLVAHVSREGYVAIGTAFNPAVAATRAAHPLHIVSSGTGQELFITAENYDANQNATMRLGRARGTFAAPAIVQAGDILGEYEFFAYTNQWHHCAEMRSEVWGAPAAGVIPDSSLRFHVTEAGGEFARLHILPDGKLVIGGAALLTQAQITAQKFGRIWIANNGEVEQLNLQLAGNNSNSASFYFSKSRGTLDTPTIVSNGDTIGYMQARAYTNAWHDNLAAVAFYVDAATVAGQRPASRIVLRTQQNNAGGPSDRVIVDRDGNVGIRTTSFGTNSQGVLGVANAAVVPAGNPSGGGVLYAEAGAGKWRGSGGTITTFGPADPHCPVCGSDFGVEFERTPDVEPDPQKRYLALCFQCLLTHMNGEDGGRPKPWVRREVPVRIPEQASPQARGVVES